MATPTAKSESIKGLLDSLTFNSFGLARSLAIIDDTCVVCHKPATTFKDEISKREYTISGLCQECQDKTFDA